MKTILGKFLVAWVIVCAWPFFLLENSLPNGLKQFFLSPGYILTIGLVLFVGILIEESYKRIRDEKQADVFQEEEGDEVTSDSGLKYKDLKVGHGTEAKSGHTVVVHYTGWLIDGTKFDTSRGRKGIGELLWDLRFPTLVSAATPYGGFGAKRYGGIFNGDLRDPVSFRVGGDGTMQGWNEGIAGMKVGGKRRLIIPPTLGYGAEGKGMVPANATLVFVVELVDVL